MATEREWLASQGLAKANSRGRYSNAAKEALANARANGQTFDDPAYKVAQASRNAAGLDNPVTAVPNPNGVGTVVVPEPELDGQESLFGDDDGPKVRRVTINPEIVRPVVQIPVRSRENSRFVAESDSSRLVYDTCFNVNCLQHITYCKCVGGPKPPGGGMFTRID